MTFAPDGRLFLSQRPRKLRVVKNGQLLAQSFVSLTVDRAGHRGLMGVAFVVTGESAQQGGAVARSMTSLLGKTLSHNPDGSIPTDNPFYTTATGKDRAITAGAFYAADTRRSPAEYSGTSRVEGPRR